MSTMLRRIGFAMLAAAALFVFPQTSSADNRGYWDNHWNWHNNHYAPYYHHNYYNNGYYNNGYYGNPYYGGGYGGYHGGYAPGYYGGYSPYYGGGYYAAPGVGVQIGGVGVGTWW